MTLTEAPPPISNQQPGDEELATLDQLIPPPMASGPRFLVAVALIVFAVVAAFLLSGGYLVPRPGEHIGPGSAGSQTIALDLERDVVGLLVYFSNQGPRDLRMTDVALDVPGLELVDTQVHQLLVGDDAFFDFSDAPCPYGVWADDCRTNLNLQGEAMSLPVTVPASTRINTQLVLWVRPTDCASIERAQDVVVATFDFGASSFPPISVTDRLERIPLWSESGSRGFGAVDLPKGQLAYPDRHPNGEWVTADGQIELICELLR